MQTVLNREQKYGTTIAAGMSAIGFGDNTLQPFNSSNTPPTNTPEGPIKVDWYTDIQASGPSLTGGGQILVYAAGKLIWTALRLTTGAPITNYLPFTDSAERNSFVQTLSPFSHYSDIFTPQFIAQNCSGGKNGSVGGGGGGGGLYGGNGPGWDGGFGTASFGSIEVVTTSIISWVLLRKSDCPTDCAVDTKASYGAGSV